MFYTLCFTKVYNLVECTKHKRNICYRTMETIYSWNRKRTHHRLIVQSCAVYLISYKQLSRALKCRNGSLSDTFSSIRLRFSAMEMLKVAVIWLFFALGSSMQQDSSNQTLQFPNTFYAEVSCQNPSPFELILHLYIIFCMKMQYNTEVQFGDLVVYGTGEQC